MGTVPAETEARSARTDSAHRFSSVKAETLSQRITRELIASIIGGHYGPGDLLPTEDDLCAQLGVSRSVIREATKAITILGMVRSRQGRGTEILPFENWNEFAPEVIEARRDLQTVDEFLVHFLELRRIIEVEAAALAAERAAEEDITTMSSLVSAMQEVGGDVTEFARLDVAFHDAIIAATGNRPLRSLLRSIEPALLTARTVSLTTHSSGLERSTNEHRAILAAIRSRSAARARRAMSSHLSWTADISLDRAEAARTRRRSKAVAPS
ncbi:MAG TPA: FCD domain-containing protein [Actinomycetota bacterium]|nr:FCD domain-containing protein [Actinomycetota bacterium]